MAYYSALISIYVLIVCHLSLVAHIHHHPHHHISRYPNRSECSNGYQVLEYQNRHRPRLPEIIQWKFRFHVIHVDTQMWKE